MAGEADKRNFRLILSLGSNQGHRKANLERALELIQSEIGSVSSISRTYETEAWGNPELSSFLNCVAIVESKLNLREAFSITLSIERQLGREKTPNAPRSKSYQDRIIDIDLLYFEEKVLNDKDLIIPHPLLQERNFVLVPLVEIAPTWIHPILKKNSTQLLEECPDTNPLRALLD